MRLRIHKGDGVAELEIVAQTMIAALMIGCIYGALCASLSLIFGIMRFVNFAHGEFMAAGMYFGFLAAGLLTALIGVTPFLAAVIAALIAVPLFYGIGRLLHVGLLSRISPDLASATSHTHQSQLVVTLGLSLILQNGALLLFGSVPRSISNPTTTEAWTFGSDDFMLFINKGRFFIAALGLAAVVVTQLILRRTSIGARMRGAADDAVAAILVGIETRRYYGIAFGISLALTAFMGALIATYYPFHPFVGLDFLIIMYAGVILGGLGSFMGSFLGGLLIGIVQQASNLFVPIQLQNAVLFLIFLLAIILRPQGIFGKQAARV
jgi:branched-chain amino acid transport system permease protein